MSDSVWSHRWQPTRLPNPWDSPGKNTGVGCHFLLQCRKVKSESEVAQSCPTLSDPMDYSPPGSSVHGIFQARVLEWDARLLGDIKACKIRSLPTGTLDCLRRPNRERPKYFLEDIGRKGSPVPPWDEQRPVPRSSHAVPGPQHQHRLGDAGLCPTFWVIGTLHV